MIYSVKTEMFCVHTGFPGLHNFGNSCFLNVILQSWAACPSLLQWLGSRCTPQRQASGSLSLTAAVLRVLKGVDDSPDTDSIPCPTDSTPCPTDSMSYPTDSTPYPTDSTPCPTDSMSYPTDSTPYPTDSTPCPTDTVINSTPYPTGNHTLSD